MSRALPIVLILAACSSSTTNSAFDANPNAADADPAAPDARPDGKPGETSGQWVLGYYVGYDTNRYPIAQLDWSGMTHVAFAPLMVNADRTLDLSFYSDHNDGVGDAKKLVAAAHAHGVKALLMLGGAGAGPNIANAATPAHRAEFVQRLIAILDTLGGYDGIDLDWEDAVDLDNLVALAHDLRAAKPDILLSYPAGCINGNYQQVDAHMKDLAASLDRFMVQTYYPSTAVVGQGWDSWFLSPLSGAAGSHPIAIDDTLDRYAKAGVPKAKLGMGMTFYAICYTGGISGPRQPTTGGEAITGGDNDYPSSVFFAAGGTFDKASAGEKKRDAVAAQPYLSLAAPVNDPHCGTTRYISYDDEESIAAKGAFSRAQGYGGIIVWTINQGLLPANAAGGRAPNALTQALKHAFIDP
jgi:chitinase